MTEYDSIDTDFGTEQTEEVTRKAREELAKEKRDRIGRIQFASAGATKNREDVRKR